MTLTKQEVKKALKGYMNRVLTDRHGEEYCVINLGYKNAPANYHQFSEQEKAEVIEILNNLGLNNKDYSIFSGTEQRTKITEVKILFYLDDSNI